MYLFINHRAQSPKPFSIWLRLKNDSLAKWNPEVNRQRSGAPIFASFSFLGLQLLAWYPRAVYPFGIMSSVQRKWKKGVILGKSTWKSMARKILFQYIRPLSRNANSCPEEREGLPKEGRMRTRWLRLKKVPFCAYRIWKEGIFVILMVHVVTERHLRLVGIETWIYEYKLVCCFGMNMA